MKKISDWSKISRHVNNSNNFAKLKNWYKKLIHRKNRRKVKQNPENQDERLNSREKLWNMM